MDTMYLDRVWVWVDNIACGPGPWPWPFSMLSLASNQPAVLIKVENDTSSRRGFLVIILRLNKSKYKRVLLQRYPQHDVDGFFNNNH